MKHNDYWRERFEQLQTAQMNKGIDYYNHLAEEYEKAAANIQKEINAFYSRFATENQVSLTEAKKILSKRELKEFQWSVQEYIEKGKTLNYSNEWAKELENASTRYRITRLEAMKLQMQQQVEALTAKEVDGIDKLMRDIYEDGYYRSAFLVQKGFGVGSSFMRLDTNKIDKVMSKPYAPDGKNFSERIWGEHRPQLVQKLNTDLVQSIIRGDDPQKLINKLHKDFDVSKRQAGKLVMTESAFFASASTHDALKELGCKMFEVSAALDSHTCSDCGGREGTPIPLSEYEVAVTAPPFHSNCRCTTLPYYEDDEPSYRAARDAEGNYIQVPENMTYKQWQEKYLQTSKPKPQIDSNVTFLKNITDYDVSTPTKRKKLARQVLDELGLEDIPVHIKKIQPHGYCRIDSGTLDANVLEYVLDSGDLRDDVYKIKTMFHEAYHAKGHTHLSDITIIGQDAWTDIEEIFAETSSHYITRQAGFDQVLSPSYADKFIKVLPRLKQLDDYKDFETIMDFGKWGWANRVTDGKAVWGNHYAHAMQIKFDWKKYVNDNYIEHIDKNLDSLLDRMLDNMPQYRQFKSNMQSDYLSAKNKLKSGGKLDSNEEMVLTNLAANAMMEVGIK